MIYVKIYIISQLFRLASGSPWDKLPKECGITRYDKFKPRIIDGDRASLGQFPWIVMIGQTQNGSEINFYCGGSLVNRYYVVTAAHCEEDGDIVRVGENVVLTGRDCDRHGDCAPPHQDIKIKKYKYLNFNHRTHANDLGLVELERPAEFNEFVRPICLPREPIAHKDLIGRYVAVAGWGVVDIMEYTPSTHLMYMNAPIVPAGECNAIYPQRLQEGQLCIGYSEGGMDSCGGDSGGPASMSLKVNGVRRTYLIALVSYGLTMCGRSVAVYTDVTYYINWILENIDKS